MSIDFNGTTSKLEHLSADLGVTTQFTICAHVFADGQGEGSFGNICAISETGSPIRFRHRSGANLLQLFAAWTAIGEWSIPANDGQWNAVSVSYDAGSASNDPIARVGYQSVTVTETSTPSGTFTTPETGYCVGNIANSTRTWDGMIQQVQVFNTILTPGEMDQACRRPGSVRRGLKLWLPMLHAGHVVDWSGSGFNGTATALTDRVGGPPAAPLLTEMMFPTFFTAGGAETPMGWNVQSGFPARRRRGIVADGMRPSNL